MAAFSNSRWCAKCQDRPRAPSHAYCRECRNEYQGRYRRTRYATDGAYRTRMRRQARLSRYGLSSERYDELWAQQGGVCAICLCDTEDRELYVDHDHDTGAVRGLLCANCNGAIGMLQDRPALLERAKEYLK